MKIKKFLDRYLDGYYADKLVEDLKWHLIINYNADCRIADDVSTGLVRIEAKISSLSDSYYTTIYSFQKTEAIVILCNLDEAQSQIALAYGRLVNYQKKNIVL